jgi:putative toxin-antitoxin system antitoxin component (TIGR02293 family)
MLFVFQSAPRVMSSHSDPQTELDALLSLARREDRLAPLSLDDLRRGLPVEVLDETADAYGLTPTALARCIGLNDRTLGRRRESASARLTAAETDRLLHARDLFDMAVDAFDGRSDEAARWLTTPKVALDGRTPAEHLDTRFNTALVEQMLISIAHLSPV